MTSTAEKLDFCLDFLTHSSNSHYRHVNQAIAEIARRHYGEVLELAKENLAKLNGREADRISRLRGVSSYARVSDTN